MNEKQQQPVKIVPRVDVPAKAPKPPDVLTITIEIPVAVDQTTDIRAEVAMLKTLMGRYRSPAQRFARELGLA